MSSTPKPLAGLLASLGLAGALCVTNSPARAAEHSSLATPTTISVYARVLHHINPDMPSWQSHDLARHVLANAQRWRIDPKVLVAIVTVESQWNTGAISPAGAIGLGQLMPGTAATLRVNPHNPAQNLSGAARYLSGLLSRFGNYRLAFAAYNAGPRAVENYGGVPPYAETQNYVVRVMSQFKHLVATVHVPKAHSTESAADKALVAAKASIQDLNYWTESGDETL